MAAKNKVIAKFDKNDLFLPLCVYQFPLGNCGGITDKLTREYIWIPCNEGWMKFKNIKEKKLIFIPEQRGENYHALRPFIQPVGSWGPMAGGNLAYSCDSRCKVVYHIHDRFEF